MKGHHSGGKIPASRRQPPEQSLPPIAGQTILSRAVITVGSTTRHREFG